MPVAKTRAKIRNMLGFKDAGYITIYFGETYPNLDWFHTKAVCRYNKIFGWYTPSDEEVPMDVPEGVKTGKIYWNDIASNDSEIDEDRASKVIEAYIYKDVNHGDFVGEVGDKIEAALTVKKAIEVSGYYGTSTMHIMEDKNGNTLVWTTAARSLEVGKTYWVKGKVKSHRIYRGVYQTVLTNCRKVKEMDEEE